MRIVNFGQVVDLENGGGFAHQFTVLLDNGDRISIVTNEDTLQQLIELAAELQGPESEIDYDTHDSTVGRLERRLEMVPPLDPGELGSEESVLISPVMGEVVTPPAELTPKVEFGGLGNRVPRVPSPMIDQDGFMIRPPAKTVSKDEMGYPISRAKQAPAPAVGDEEDVGFQI